MTSKKFYAEVKALEDNKSNLTELHDLPTSKYVKNVCLLTILWTNSSFSMYTLNYMNKHFEGNIFVNYYLEGAAGIIGTLIAAPVYSYLKIRWSFITTLIFTNIFLFLFFIH